MIDFRDLSYFVATCEHENLGDAARTLGIAPSTLSANLKSLEADFGVRLFRKRGNGLSPRELAHWLYRAAVPVLLLERFARNRLAAPLGEPIARLHVDIHLRFAFGQFRRALSIAIARTNTEEPLLLVEPEWPLGLRGAFSVEATEMLDFAEKAQVVIDAVAREADEDSGEVHLHTDAWVRLRRQIGTDEPERAIGEFPLLVPEFPDFLIDQVRSWASSQGLRVEAVATPPRDWPQLLDDYPSANLLLPASAVGTRLGVTRVEALPLSPPLSSNIIARSDGQAISGRFLERLRGAFGGDGPTPIFEPILTSRRLNYLNLIYELGRISAAARASNVAQPALSQQLLKLEESLGTSLFDRRTTGLIRTDAGSEFAISAGLLERRIKEVETGGRVAALTESGRLSLGVLPSVGRNSRLANSIAEAFAGLRQRYPAMHVTVREAPTGEMLEMVRRSEVGLAIVETVLPQMPRLPLAVTEQLAVVADPRHDLFPLGSVRLADLAGIPLVMPTRGFGIRKMIEKEAREHSLNLEIRHEIDTLAMMIAHLPWEAVAAILPLSTVAAEIADGKLVGHPIIEPSIERRLFMTYSGDRSLTSIEREFIKILRQIVADNSVAGITEQGFSRNS